MKKIYLLFLAIFLLFSPCIFSQKRDLTLNDIWGNKKLFITPVKGFQSMNDGIRYTEMIQNEKTNATDILIYDYKTGKVLDTLIHGNRLFRPGSDSVLSFSDYELNASATLVIFTTEEEAIYRHSSKANYYIYNIIKGTLMPVSEKGILTGSCFWKMHEVMQSLQTRWPVPGHIGLSSMTNANAANESPLFFRTCISEIFSSKGQPANLTLSELRLTAPSFSWKPCAQESLARSWQ